MYCLKSFYFIDYICLTVIEIELLQQIYIFGALWKWKMFYGNLKSPTIYLAYLVKNPSLVYI